MALPIVKISPSQLITYMLCPRKWAWDKLDGIRAPGDKYTKFGTEVHDHLERWLKYGIIPPDTDTGRCANALLKYLPPPGDDLAVECWYELDVGDGVVLHGKRDLKYRTPDGRLVVHDHKTTGDLKWAKHSEDLLTDPQSVQYAVTAMEEEQEEEVTLEWGYVVRSNRRTRLVSLLVHRDQIESTFNEHVAIAKKMAEIKRSGARAMDLEPNPKACDAYRGCFYATDHCKMTPHERMKAIMAQGKLAESLKRRQQEKAAAAKAAPKATPEAAPKAATAPKTVPKLGGNKAKSTGGINPPERPSPERPSPELVETVQATTQAEVFAVLGLRDTLAAHALAGLAANPAMASTSSDALAAAAYRLADAALVARS